MTIRDVRQALDETSASETAVVGDDEVQITVKAGRARVIVTAGKNRVTVRTDKVGVAGKADLSDKIQVSVADHEIGDSPLMVVSQINEA